MNTVLLSEILKYRNLCKVIRTSLADLVKAFDGLLQLTPRLEELQQNLENV
jgi:hypothetical protein